MGYAFVVLCLFSSTIVLTTACDKDDEELEYREEQTGGKENPEQGDNSKEEGEGGLNKPIGIVGEAIDLGLSVMWASHNVGAAKPEDYGDYFAWGETTPKNNYSWGTYKYGSGKDKLTKYCTNADYGTDDNKTVLEASDDAAAANWGNGWRMPKQQEVQELHEECTFTWTTQNGVNGYLVVGPNGNSIFLPAAGCRYGTSLSSAGGYGDYWSSSLYMDRPNNEYEPNYAVDLGFYSDLHYKDIGDRCYGQSVRPVRTYAQN